MLCLITTLALAIAYAAYVVTDVIRYQADRRRRRREAGSRGFEVGPVERPGDSPPT